MEQMLKAADQSMSGVRQKIQDIVKQKELIESVVKLRSIREQSRTHSTYGITAMFVQLTELIGCFINEHLLLSIYCHKYLLSSMIIKAALH
ncbi:hypothetical protein EB796_022090 [Bugula neritina]|uniref:Uncharacterized protein n=1 Tax=Bugula neritina TaxID=10212 RepID=A0A7J7J1B3_BUGNE|nr:hypothetical protein EB796_022090 [Bugula neritina]